ncbi:MAG TPA: sensor domain-containing diguanylate cyclase [Terriglobales bacterium]|nr:sensor domain-containing diguanylate cyclase [Terriglobales bacterium]
MKELYSSVREVAVLQEATDMVLSSMDADTALHHMLLVSRNYFGVSACAVMLVDAEKHELYIHTHNGFTDAEVLGRRYKIGHDGISGYVASTKAPLYVADVSKEPRYVSGSADVRSELALPLVVRDELLGVLTLSSDQTDYFSDEMIGLLTLFAGQASVALDNTRLYSTERRRMRQIEFVNLIARSATTAHDIETLVATLSELISDTFEGSEVSFILRSANGQFSLTTHAGGEMPLASEFHASLRNGAIADALAARTQVSIPNCEQKEKDSPSWKRFLPKSGSELAVPLLSLGEILGAVMISQSKVNAFTPEDRSIAQAAGDVCATAIRNVQLSAELLRVTNTDSLTGVFNQRYFHVAVSHEIIRAKRCAKPFSLLMFDLKGFAAINRETGFDSGDEALRSVSQTIRAMLRGIDTICRFNADRFALILPETDATQLKPLQAKLASGLRAITLSAAKHKLDAVFASVEYPHDGANETELARQLLQRMERAKSSVKRAGQI